MDESNLDIIRYVVAIFLLLFCLPLSDALVSYLSKEVRKAGKVEYNNFLGNNFVIFGLRLVFFLIIFVISGYIAGFNMNLVIGGIGILSLMLPITLQSPAQDLVCGMLMISMDKIRVGEIIRIDELKVEGSIIDINTFSTSIISPLTNAITEISNSKLWTMTIQSISRSPDQKIDLHLIISNRNNIGITESLIRKILLSYPNVQSNIDFAYTSSDFRGLSLIIAVPINSNKKNYLLTQNDLYKYLKSELQKYGIIFIDGSNPVQIRNKSNVVTPIIVNSITEEYIN